MALFQNYKISKASLALICILGIAGISLTVFGLYNMLSGEFHQQKEQKDLNVQSQILKDEIKYLLDESLKKQNYLRQLSEELDYISRRSQAVKYLLDNNKKENAKIQEALAQARQELFKDKENKGSSPSSTSLNAKNDDANYLNNTNDLGPKYIDLKNRIESIRDDLDDAKKALANRTLGDPAFKDELRRQQQELDKNYALVNMLHEQISNMVLTQQAMEDFSKMMGDLESSARDYKSSMHKR